MMPIHTNLTETNTFKNKQIAHRYIMNYNKIVKTII
jgi:hypothetical protein